MELEQDLRLTSDELLRTLERLRELEIEKRSLTPGTVRFRRIAGEIEKLAATILTKTVEQEQLAAESVAVREQTGVVSPPINDIALKRDIQLILGEWREAERRLSTAASGTPEHLEALAAVRRLRAEYRDATGVAGGGAPSADSLSSGAEASTANSDQQR